MKKVLSLFVLLLALVLVGCKEQEQPKEVVEYEVLNTQTFKVDKVQKVELEKNREAYLYFQYDVAKKEYIPFVVSGLLYEVNDQVEVLNIKLKDFNYSVIHLGDNLLDTSYHKYLERV